MVLLWRLWMFMLFLRYYESGVRVECTVYCSGRQSLSVTMTVHCTLQYLNMLLRVQATRTVDNITNTVQVQVEYY
jgi:hypothetical protein